MASDTEEYESALILIRDNYRRLRKTDPNNPLLRYILRVDDEGILFNNKLREEFIREFGNPNKPSNLEIMAKYAFALFDAVEASAQTSPSRMKVGDRFALDPTGGVDERDYDPFE